MFIVIVIVIEDKNRKPTRDRKRKKERRAETAREISRETCEKRERHERREGCIRRVTERQSDTSRDAPVSKRVHICRQNDRVSRDTRAL